MSLKHKSHIFWATPCTYQAGQLSSCKDTVTDDEQSFQEYLNKNTLRSWLFPWWHCQISPNERREQERFCKLKNLLQMPRPTWRQLLDRQLLTGQVGSNHETQRKWEDCYLLWEENSWRTVRELIAVTGNFGNMNADSWWIFLIIKLSPQLPG